MTSPMREWGPEERADWLSKHGADVDMLLMTKDEIDTLRLELTRLQKAVMDAGHPEIYHRQQKGIADARLVEENDHLKEQIAALRRGEFVCGKCGLRKDREFKKGDF